MYQQFKNMSNIIITGANGGLGLAVTSRLSDEGYQIVAVTGKAGAGQVIQAKNVAAAEVDLLDEKAAESFIRTHLGENPGTDAAVLLVGGFAMGRLQETSNADLGRMVDLNFYTAFNVVRPLLKHFLENGGGRFILVGSRPGLDAAAGKDFFAYALSKAMIFKLAEFINAEGKDKNVDAVVIVPSTIDTEANRKAMPNADFTKWVTPAAIAEAISFYLSVNGRMIKEAVVKLYNRS